MEKVATRWRLIGDPYAPESVWLPACAADLGLPVGSTSAAHLTRSMSDPSPVATAVASALRLSAALFLSGAFAYVTYMSVHLGFDWGYKLVERLFGHTAEADQAMSASF